MAATVTSTMSSFRQPKGKANSNSMQFIDEDFASVPVSGVSKEFRKLSRFLPMLVLVPKSAVRHKTADKESVSGKLVACLSDTTVVSSPLDAAKAWFRNPGAADTFEFGEVTICFSTMEIHRNGRLVTLTCKEFKSLAYLIKNVRRVISRDELLNEVWGYQSYPCTRTVDNHIWRLRKKLEADPANPKHIHTVHGTGYRFLP